MTLNSRNHTMLGAATYVCVFPAVFFLYLYPKELYRSVVWSPLGRASISASWDIFFRNRCQHNFRPWRPSWPRHYCHYFLKNHRISTAKNYGVCSSWCVTRGNSLPTLQRLIVQTLLTTKAELCFMRVESAQDQITLPPPMLGQLAHRIFQKSPIIPSHALSM